MVAPSKCAVRLSSALRDWCIGFLRYEEGNGVGGDGGERRKEEAGRGELVVVVVVVGWRRLWGMDVLLGNEKR